MKFVYVTTRDLGNFVSENQFMYIPALLHQYLLLGCADHTNNRTVFTSPAGLIYTDAAQCPVEGVG
jgi:hypothetical protein